MSLLPAFSALSSLDAFARHAAGALIASLWEGLLLVGAIAVCFRLISKTTPRLRFLVWIAAFLVLAFLPLISEWFAVHVSAKASISSAAHVELDPRWSYALAAIWFSAVIVRCAHLALQGMKLRSLWNSATPVAPDRLPRLQLGTVQLCTSNQVDRPSVIGFFAPRILVPGWLFEQLTPGELHQIVLHELEHLRRRDDWMNLLQKIGLVLFPLNPALFWIDRRLATERELACDDGVLGQTRAPRAYATCLTSIAERRLEHRRHHPVSALALGVMGAVGAIRRTDLSRRIESILAGRPSLSPVAARALGGFLIAGVCGGALALARAPQLVSFTAADQVRPVAAMAETRPAISTVRQPSSAHFEDVVFHTPQPTAGSALALGPARLKTKPKSALRASQGEAVQVRAGHSAVTRRANRRWMLLTSWQSTPQPVLVTLPDGRTFLATYAADPNANAYRAGWLLIQL